MHSMTGYGKASVSLNGLNIHAQMRSVNHRFLNCQINLPETLFDFNSRIETLIRKHITRGSINFSLKIEIDGKDQGSTLNIPLIKNYHKQLKSIRKNLSLKDEISINTILNLPGTYSSTHSPQTSKKVKWSAIERLVIKTTSNLVKMREREGKRLKTSLQQIIKKMRSIKNKIKKRTPAVINNYYRTLSKRVEDMLNNMKTIAADKKEENNNINQRIASEVAFFAQRVDITEEIHRLDSHLDSFFHTMNQKGELGKKLDFITQEMLREVNTIASKANDASVSGYTITLKSYIDKLKEQVQNIQ